MIKFLKKMFHRCEYEHVSGSMIRNGYQDVDFMLLFRPEYDAIERCSCGNARKTTFLSYADTGQIKPIEGLKIHTRNKL